MSNLSKERRDRMIAKLEELKQQHNDDASIAALNEIENALREKKYGLVWEEHSEAVDDMLKENIPVLVEDPERRLCKDPSLPWNFIIEGDNLQALYLLEKTHRGKVDCIYIDPPYNTGARDWKYNNDYVDGNDEYRHSKWLSMMKSRLVAAKRLLNPKDSVMIVTIDEKEYLHLGCLLEELFPEANIQMVSDVINRTGSIRQNMFARADEYIFFVVVGEAYAQFGLNDMLNPVEEKKGTFQHLIRGGSNGLREKRPNLFYPIFFKCEDGSYHSVGDALNLEENRNEVAVPPGCFAVWPLTQSGIECTWGVNPETFKIKKEKGYISFGKWKKGSTTRWVGFLQSGTEKAVEEGIIEVLGKDADGALVLGKSLKPTRALTVWNQVSHDAGTYGASMLNQFFTERRFNYPKSLYSTADAIRFFTKEKKNATIIDFFSGSGTTMHAVNLLNAEDSGNRKCIMVTNNEISETEQKDFEIKGIHSGDREWEDRGIAKYVTWPRTVCSINGVDITGKPLKGNYIGSDIPMADGFQANVKYMKCDWTPRKPEEYLLSNALCLHVKELIELQTAQEVDGSKNVIILSKSDYNRIFGDVEIAEKVEKVWVNQNLVFNADEMRILRAKRFRYIPREFFSQELKEAGEYV